MHLELPRFTAAFGSLCAEGVRALARHKLRSALTALGIAIGVAAVLCVVAIGTAGSELAAGEFDKVGTNLVWVEAGSRNINGVQTGSHGTTSLTVEDMQAIAREVPLLRGVSPQLDGYLSVAYGDRNWTSPYRGVSPEYLDIKRWEIAAGAAFTHKQVEESASVVLIGDTLRDRLFGQEDPLGKQVRIKNQLFEVIGVLKPKGGSSTGRDKDDTLLLPYTTTQRKILGKGFSWLNDILCSAVSREAVNPAIDRVTTLLRQRHGIQPGDEDDFNIRRPDAVVHAQIEASRHLSAMLIAIASVSLLVGGIGIMNVMLVSVTERTREIGLRMAVGATQGAVHIQFLAEAVTLSLFGAVAGVVFGVLGSVVIGHALEWPVTIPPRALAIAPAFAVSVGVCFGFYPAWRAARMDPVEALLR